MKYLLNFLKTTLAMIVAVVVSAITQLKIVTKKPSFFVNAFRYCVEKVAWTQQSVSKTTTPAAFLSSASPCLDMGCDSGGKQRTSGLVLKAFGLARFATLTIGAGAWLLILPKMVMMSLVRCCKALALSLGTWFSFAELTQQCRENKLISTQQCRENTAQQGSLAKILHFGQAGKGLTFSWQRGASQTAA